MVGVTRWPRVVRVLGASHVAHVKATGRFLVVVAALAVVGCGVFDQSGWSFQLITGRAPKIEGRCFGHEQASFVLDRMYGVALEWSDGTGPVPVAWPRGYTARWVGPQIQVFDQDGVFRLETGKTYDYWSAGTIKPEDWVGVPLPAAGAYYICGAGVMDERSG